MNKVKHILISIKKYNRLLTTIENKEKLIRSQEEIISELKERINGKYIPLADDSDRNSILTDNGSGMN